MSILYEEIQPLIVHTKDAASDAPDPAAKDLPSAMVTALIHEIKNPAAVALAHVGLLRQAKTEAERLASYERIECALDDIETLAHELLCATHSLAPAQVQPIDLCTCLEEMCDTYQAAWPSIKFTLHRHAATAPLLVYAHPASLRMVCGNVLKNAAQAAVPNGCVTLRVSLEDDWVRLTVHNNGAPYQPDATVQKNQRGNGLGLPITRWLLAGMGGTLEIGAGEIGGCKATVRLPR